MSKTLVAVFSYNRGEYLKNCVQSIEKHFNFEYELHIYDDQSDEPETLEILQELRSKHTVLVASAFDENEKLRGLYANMNRALEYCYQNNVDYFLAIQDDMQVVRDVSDDEWATVVGAEMIEDIGSVKYLFWKDNKLPHLKDHLSYNSEHCVYVPSESDKSKHLGMVDTGVFFVRKLKDAEFLFGRSEQNTQATSKKMFLNRAAYQFPFIGFLPWPGTNRDNYPLHKRILLSITDSLFRTGFHPYKSMTETEVEKLSNYEVFNPPTHSEFLSTKSGVSLVSPYNFYDSIIGLKLHIIYLLSKGKKSEK